MSGRNVDRYGQRVSDAPEYLCDEVVMLRRPGRACSDAVSDCVGARSAEVPVTAERRRSVQMENLPTSRSTSSVPSKRADVARRDAPRRSNRQIAARTSAIRLLPMPTAMQLSTSDPEGSTEFTNEMGPPEGPRGSDGSSNHPHQLSFTVDMSRSCGKKETRQRNEPAIASCLPSSMDVSSNSRQSPAVNSVPTTEAIISQGLPGTYDSSGTRPLPGEATSVISADKSDNVSEAGTYVIDHEGDEDDQLSGSTPTQLRSSVVAGSSGTSTVELEHDLDNGLSSADTDPARSQGVVLGGGGSDWVQRWVADASRQNLRIRSARSKIGGQRPCSVAACDSSELKSMLMQDAPFARHNTGLSGLSAQNAVERGVTQRNRACTSRPDLLVHCSGRGRAATAVTRNADVSSRTHSSLTGLSNDGDDCSSSTGVKSSTRELEPKYNRAVCLRRARLTDTRSPASVTAARVDAGTSPAGTCLLRNDGGRFSLRTDRGKGAVTMGVGDMNRSKTPLKFAPKHINCDKNRQELENWNRRKSYNPMLSARANKKSIDQQNLERKNGSTLSRDASSDVLPKRSSSFHVVGCGSAESTDARIAGGRKQPLVQVQVQPSALPFPLRRRRSVDATDSGADSKSGPNHVDTSLRVPGTAKKALDSFIINTILTLSKKLKSSSESLVTKLKGNFDEQDVRFTMLEDVLSTLSSCSNERIGVDSSSATASRHLAAILRNLRAVEQTVQVLEQALCENTDGDFSDVDDEELAALLQKINDENFH